MISSITPAWAPKGRRLAGAALYAHSSAISALALALALWILASILWRPSLALAFSAAVVYGIVQSETGLSLPLPSRHWQVPARWVANPALAPLVWGVCLGPGIFTHCPYAAYAIALSISTSTATAWLPIYLGLTFGLMRAAPVLLSSVRTGVAGGSECSAMLGQRAIWTYIDSAVLLFFGAGGMTFLVVQ